jgi:ribonuclease HI
MYVSADYLNSGLTIVCDGGALNNQDASSRKAYGSFAVLQDGVIVASTYAGHKQTRHTFDFQGVTNNVAELLTMRHALLYVKDLLKRGRKLTAPISICSDSWLALNGATKPVEQMGKQHAVHLEPFYNELHALAVELKGSIELCKVERSDVVRVLGH